MTDQPDLLDITTELAILKAHPNTPEAAIAAELILDAMRQLEAALGISQPGD